MDKTLLGDRMKNYEKISSPRLTRRVPVIIRIDGRAFHTLTQQLFGKNYSPVFSSSMIEVASTVTGDIQGCNFCYGQSDEVSFLLTDYRTIKTDAWFGYNINKIVSASASLASAVATNLFDRLATFDARAFSIPRDDVANYFIWRQRDATRNAINMFAQEHYSHKQLHRKSTEHLHDMLHEKGYNFNDLPIMRKRGFCILDRALDVEIPVFSKDRDFIEQFVDIRED